MIHVVRLPFVTCFGIYLSPDALTQSQSSLNLLTLFVIVIVIVVR